MATCSSCDKEREHVAALGCHPEVAICGPCISWLRSSLPRSVESTAAGYQPSMPWGMRELRVADPSGNLIRVGQPSPDPSPA
ncbi:MAG: hypothetical protein ABW279_06475 [Acidimicrobiales bacterium]